MDRSSFYQLEKSFSTSPSKKKLRERSSLIAKYREESRALHQDKWMDVHKKEKSFAFSRNELKILKEWFDVMDKDHSGTVDMMELEDPLLSMGVASNIDDIKRILKQVDTDGSGQVEFCEFVDILTPKEKEKGSCTPFMQLQDQMKEQQSGMLSVNTLISIQRRKFLLEAITSDVMNSNEVEEAEIKKLEKQHIANREMKIFSHLQQKKHKIRLKRREFKERFVALQTVIQRNATQKLPDCISALQAGEKETKKLPALIRKLTKAIKENKYEIDPSIKFAAFSEKDGEVNDELPTILNQKQLKYK